MPVDKNRYPKNWRTIVALVAIRSGGQCECTSECGLHTTTGRCIERHGQKAIFAKGKVVLTCAHMGVLKEDGSPGDKHDKQDCRMENLKHLCQRCHLRFDIDEHKANSKKTRERKKWTNQEALKL